MMLVGDLCYGVCMATVPGVLHGYVYVYWGSSNLTVSCEEHTPERIGDRAGTARIHACWGGDLYILQRRDASRLDESGSPPLQGVGSSPLRGPDDIDATL
jgi:hypothetical protein